MSNDFTKALVDPEATIADVIRTIGASNLQIALVVDAERKLLGTITDGDIRRGIMRSTDLTQPARSIMFLKPTTVPPGATDDECLAVMRRKSIHHLPVLDAAGRVVALRTVDELLGPVGASRPNWAVILAGGLGTRLKPLTDTTPKPLLRVGRRPILETIVEQLKAHGIGTIFLAVRHRAEAMKAHFGDGSAFDVAIRYIEEDTPLGTAGALGLLPETPAEPFIVMNGDILTKVDFGNLLAFHAEQGAVATVAARDLDVEIPFGVLDIEGERITGIREKPVLRHAVSAGIYVLSPEVLAGISGKERLDMPDLMQNLLAAGKQVSPFPIHEYWLDIGQHDDFKRAVDEFDTVFENGDGD